MRFDTRLVRAGQEPTGGTGDLVPPVHLSTAYDRRVQDPPRYFYGRGENPTREGLERCLASIEDTRYAAVFASGQAAAATALSLLPPGRALLASDDLYPGSDALFRMRADLCGATVHYADLSDPDRRDAALRAPDLGMVWLETPTNPTLRVVDVAAVRARLAGRTALLLVDNTFATPVLQRPLDLGADIALYSTTKFIGGHGDVLGGALVYDDAGLDARIREHRAVLGNVPGPLDCYLVHRGLKTLSLRVARQVDNARAVVDALRASPAVGAVHYPGLPDHPQYAVAKRQMAEPGSIVSFEYRGDPRRLLDRVRLFSCAVSLGGVQSLIECPAMMTHRPLGPQVRARRGISDSLVRLSVGIEDPRDLVDDLRVALTE
jgi:cystathionine beta-lyase/cystathionine gamma-synthase